MMSSGALLLAALAGAGGTVVPSYDSYKSWLIACDNVLSCEAKGFEDGTNDYPDLRFDRDGGPGAATKVVFSAPFKAGLTDLRVDGKPLRFDPAAWKVDRAVSRLFRPTGQPPSRH